MEENYKVCISRRPLLYGRWASIKQRCTNPNDRNYKWYGGRGIKLCDEWFNNFRAFETYVYNTLGKPTQSKQQLDRINNNEDYKPGNIRWSSDVENKNNTSTNVLIEYNNKIYRVNKLYDILQPIVSRDVFRDRVGRQTWDVQKAATTPVGKHKQKFYFKGEMLTLREIYDKYECIVNYGTFRSRVTQSNWDIERALIIPLTTVKIKPKRTGKKLSKMRNTYKVPNVVKTIVKPINKFVLFLANRKYYYINVIHHRR